MKGLSNKQWRKDNSLFASVSRRKARSEVRQCKRTTNSYNPSMELTKALQAAFD